MQISLDQIRRAALNQPKEANAAAVIVALNRYGAKFGLDQPHRLAQFLPQLMHESLDFRYDREVWGPTPAQRRYEGRKDLGNTQPGDGELYMGRTGIQITGRANYAAFRDWCRANIDPRAPDFVVAPDKVNTDPWEGLAPIWYWSTRKLNRAADEGDAEMITRKINGGLNGYEDRLRRLTRVSLVLLGYGADEVARFQKDAGLALVDGLAGPKTRGALHQALVRLTAGAAARPEVKAAPVTEEKPVAVAPVELDKPVTQTSGFWERVSSIGAGAGGLGALLFGDWRVTAAALVGMVVIAGLGLLFHARIIAAVKSIKAEIA